MKKGIIALLSFIFFISLHAQESDSPPKSDLTPTYSEGVKKGQNNFRAGIKAGLTASVISGDNFPFQGFNKLGAFLGPFVNVPVSRDGKWLMQMELNFIMKGCKHSPRFDENGNIVGPVTELYKLQLMYGQIPILAKWRFVRGFELEFGPAFGILFQTTDVEWVNTFLNIGAPPFARFEFSGIVGLNYLFYNHYGVSLRYESSLIPVRKPRASDWIYLLRGQYNSTFVFSVYYQF